jgi:hypothetical protein
MTKHDTWVRLKPNSPYQPILHLFNSEMIPMRDPFGMERAKDDSGKKIVLWIIDLERLSSVQANSLAQLIATHRGVDAVEVATEAHNKGGFAMSSEWIESMMCGAEGMQRGKELADFLETAPQPPSKSAVDDFYQDQRARWIDGNEVPPPMPRRIEDFDPRLRTPELEVALQREQINNALAGYSVFDVLTGRAMIDILNQIDPNHKYSSVGEDSDEDDDFYG